MSRAAVMLCAVASLGAGGSLHIQTGDVPGSDGQWQQATAVVDAPLDEVRGWLTDYDHWPELFKDIKSAQVLARPGPSGATVRFYSKIVGREMTMNVVWTKRYIVYRGTGANVDAQGRIALVP